MQKNPNAEGSFRALEEKIDRLFDEVAGMRFRGTPDILDRFDRFAADLDRKRHRSRTLWTRVSLAAATAALAAIVFQMRSGPEGFPAVVEQKLAMVLDLSEGLRHPGCSVRVELAPGVEFYSESHPTEVARSSLEFPCDLIKDGDEGTVPIVVQGREAGDKTVTVAFFDKNQREITKRELKVHFSSSQEKS